MNVQQDLEGVPGPHSRDVFGRRRETGGHLVGMVVPGILYDGMSTSVSGGRIIIYRNEEALPERTAQSFQWPCQHRISVAHMKEEDVLCEGTRKPAV